MYFLARKCIWNQRVEGHSCFVVSTSVYQYQAGDMRSLQRRLNVRDGVLSHQPHDCLLNRLFADHRKRQKSASLSFVRGIHRWPVISPHKWPVTRKKSFHRMTSSWSSRNNNLLFFGYYTTAHQIWAHAVITYTCMHVRIWSQIYNHMHPST